MACSGRAITGSLFRRSLGIGLKCTLSISGNHGRSPHSGEFNYRVMADDVNDLLIDEGMGSVYVLGHSMGGKTAMQFALMYPDKVGKLVVVDIAPKAYPPKHDAIFHALFSLKLEQYKTRQELDTELSRYIDDYPVRQLLLKNVVRDDEGSFKWKIDIPAIRANYDRINEAVGGMLPFKKPALFIKGSKSSYVLEADIPLIRSIFPSAELVSIENAGHWVHAEAPQKFTEVVLEFLARK